MYSLDAMYLMTCIAGVESKLTHLRQLPDGPALSLFQIEAATYTDCLRYLRVNMELRDKILAFTKRSYLPPDAYVLVTDLALSALIARVKIWMVPEAIPSYKDAQAQAAYYERYYNVNKSNDKTNEFVKFAGEIGGWINHEDTTN